MAWTIGIPAEREGEPRCAISADVVKRYQRVGISVIVEDSLAERQPDLLEAGATRGSRQEVLATDMVCMINPPEDEVLDGMRAGSIFVGHLAPLDQPRRAEAFAKRGIHAIAMELVPRISRAQKMDALSALSSIAGYRAVLEAATALPRFFPLLTTAAGTIKPANVLVLGAGVAGLQAIATAKRLGARVSAYDIREAVREEIHSLGATFVELPLEMDDQQDAGGYAKALEAEKAARQVELLVPFLAKADVVISTALIPGRPAPQLISKEAVEAMSAGAVIIDLAAANGGNCALTKADANVVHQGVTILGPTNITAGVADHATQMYARTLMALVLEFFDAESGTFTVNMEDEILQGAVVTLDGSVVQPRIQSLITGA
jgi:NAD(P) transhydrogenase subunit alpha